jgi:hypothetical protein
MVPGEEYFNNILSRVKSKAPSSVVIENSTISDKSFTDGFLSVQGELLKQASILPVRVDCGLYLESLSIWKGIAKAIETAMPIVFDGDDLTDDYFTIISDTDDTDDVQSYLIDIIDDIYENVGWRMMLILEHFDAAIKAMPEYDIMKIREMTETLAIVTITRISLEDLCEQRYQSIYFANQFLDASFIK